MGHIQIANVKEFNPFEKLTLAKIDIEGAELLALKGSISLLVQKRPQVWILEILGTGSHELVNFSIVMAIVSINTAPIRTKLVPFPLSKSEVITC